LDCSEPDFRNASRDFPGQFLGFMDNHLDIDDNVFGIRTAICKSENLIAFLEIISCLIVSGVQRGIYSGDMLFL